MKKSVFVDPVLTQPFKKTLVAAVVAMKDLKIVGIEGPDGVGFSFALSYVARKHYVRIIVCDVEYAQKLYNVLVSLNTALSNVKLPARIARRPSTLHDVMRATNERIKVDGPALIVFDNCSRLTRSQLRYLISFFRKFNRRAGVLYRMSPTYLKSVKRRWKPEYNDLRKVTDDWGVLLDLEDEDFEDIVRAHGITDDMVINDLTNNSESDLTILAQNIERIKKSSKETKN